jgi:hypothetical protein
MKIDVVRITGPAVTLLLSPIVANPPLCLRERSRFGTRRATATGAAQECKSERAWR